MRSYLNQLGIPYFYESSSIVPRALVHMVGPKQSICSWCSRMKRGILYACARRNVSFKLRDMNMNMSN